MANTTYIDEQGRRKKGYTEGLNIPSDSIYAKRLEYLNSDTQRQINNLNADYEGMNTQLYRDYMKSKKTLPQQLSAQGISGGLSESTNLGLETLYHDRLLQNEKQRQRGIGDIEAKGSSNALGVLKDYAANAAERANTMAGIGDFSGYKELGYTDEQIAALKAAWDTKYASKVSGGGGGKKNDLNDPTIIINNDDQLGVYGKTLDRRLQGAVQGRGIETIDTVLDSIYDYVNNNMLPVYEANYILKKYKLGK